MWGGIHPAARTEVRATCDRIVGAGPSVAQEDDSIRASASIICARSASSFAISIVSLKARYSSCETSATAGRPLRRNSVRRPVSSHSPTSSLTSGGRSRMSILFSMFLQRDAEVLGEVVAEYVVFQRVINGRFQIAELLAGVVALPFEDVAVEAAVRLAVSLYKAAQRVGELNLAAGAALGRLEDREDLRRQDVAADDRVVRRRVRLRLFDHVADFEEPIADELAGHDAVARGLLGRHFHE